MNNLYKFFLVLLLLASGIIQCNKLDKKLNDSIKETYDSLIDSELILPDVSKTIIDGVIRNFEFSTLNKTKNDNYKIVSLININCSNLVQLMKWQSFYETSKSINEDIDFILYTNSEIDNDIVTDTFKNLRIDYSILIDNNNRFIDQNYIGDSPHFQTFLLDSHNQIKLVGNPILNDQIKEIYLSTIQK